MIKAASSTETSFVYGAVSEVFVILDILFVELSRKAVVINELWKYDIPHMIVTGNLFSMIYKCELLYQSIDVKQVRQYIIKI